VAEITPGQPPVAIAPIEPAQRPSIGSTIPLGEPARSSAVDAPTGEETSEREVGR
jgi:hypothetical protein